MENSMHVTAIPNSNLQNIESFAIGKVKSAHLFICTLGDKFYSAVSEDLSWVSEFFYKGSILHGFNNERLSAERAKNLNLTELDKAALGLGGGARRFVQASWYVLALSLTISVLGITYLGVSSALTLDILDIVIVAPIVEEVLFRGFIQEGLSILQSCIKQILSVASLKSHTISWLLSPACRIVVVNSLFAAAHFGNIHHGFTIVQAAVQVTLIVLTPVYSILYETTDSLSAPIVAHMTNNLFCVLLG